MAVEVENLSAESDGLAFKLELTGEDETRFRQMVNVIRDDGDVSKTFELVFKIAADAVEFLEKNQFKVYP